MRQWHWGVPLIYLLDNRKNWKVQQVADQRKILVDELNFSYRFLSRFARENGFAALINDKDMSLLGRKLYAAFERKSGKIELINPNIAPNITEENLTIMREFNPGKTGLKVGSWAVYAGLIKQADKEEFEPIKRSRSIVEILAWCYFNHIIDSATRFTLYTGETDLSEQEIRQILSSLSANYPDRLAMASQENFHTGARPQQMSLVVNVGIDPMSDMNRKGYQRITEQTDALNFSGLHKNLVLSLDQITKNTWHEVSTTHFDRDQCVVDCVVDFMRNYAPDKYSEMPKIDIVCFSPTRPQAICQRLEDLFEGILETYYRQKYRLETRYILSVGSKYFIFQFRNNQPTVKAVSSLSGLMRYLSQPQKEFSPILFDAYAHPRDPLPVLVRKNVPDVIQIFYRKLDSKTTFYIFDEMGSLVTFHESDIQEKPFINKLNLFFKSVNKRRQNTCSAGGSGQEGYQSSFYEVLNGEPFTVENRSVVSSIEDERYHNVEVIVERSFDGEQHYTIYCDHQEFSECKYGDNIFKAVAQHLLKKRKGRALYPVSITSIDLASVVQNQESLQTTYYLQQKLALEWQIDRALKSLV
jgi:adenylate cyclase class 1